MYCSKHGYFTDEAFEQDNDFLLECSNDGIPNDGKWRILIVDGYGSHTTFPTVLQKLLNIRLHRNLEKHGFHYLFLD